MNEQFSRGLADHAQLVNDLSTQCGLIADMARLIIETIEAGGRIYVIGNGGSAADAQHIAAELLGRFKLNRRALPGLALTTDTSTLLAIGNDLSFDQVFSRQIEALARRGDIVWALSTSGNSSNIVKAAQAAQAQGAKVIGFVGRGGALRPLCSLCLCIPHDSSDRVQEMHQVAYHFICEQVEQHFAGQL